VPFEAGVRMFGHEGAAFCYDNETPRHRQYVHAFAIADRLVTNAKWQEFMADGGYARPELWLSDGWFCMMASGWKAPLYWEQLDGTWHSFTLAGIRTIDPTEPVCHVSFYEADAFARWSGKRLPTEFEWELASENVPVEGNFLDSSRCHPVGLASGGRQPAEHAISSPRLHQLFGDVWEWTASPYVGYPGYKPPAGALGEYNGKFMSNQMVLRGGSCATPQSHIRRTYRNFFPPNARWQFMGVRLAEDA
jgi:ergothioneine biosynthesis protein EgtB